MKSPTELSERLAKQWQDNNTRENRLLNSSAWPLQLTIGLPSATQFLEQPAKVREHITQWRNTKIGNIIWTEKKYAGSSETISIPKYWQLKTPSEWLAATANKKIQQEFKALETIITSIDTLFHSLIIRKRYLSLSKPVQEIIQACAIAMQLTPNCANEKPLRALSVVNCDSKFFERNRNMIIQLLDIRFDGAATDLGLENFLDAMDEKDHWLLIAPLDSGIVPFQHFRLRTTELAITELPASHIIIIENEQCLHLLPKLPDTIAILGAGLDLSWLHAAWLKTKIIAYWGDIDTWGLTILANARLQQPHLTALLMDSATFDRYSDQFAVSEPQQAAPQAPSNLTTEEQALYKKLTTIENGRLEQEFIPDYDVEHILIKWYKKE